MKSLPQIEIVRLYTSPAHNFFGHHGGLAGQHPTVDMDEIHCIAGRGIEGDRFFDFKENYKGQITFFASEIYESLCQEFGVNDVPPSVFRRNVITRGVDLNSLIGMEFEIQGVRFEGMAECSPCHWMNDAFYPGVEERLKGNGGLRARILTSGVLRTKRNQNSFSVCLVAGGKSARMGCDKAGVEFNGVPLWQHQIKTLRHLDAVEILISGRAEACYGGSGFQIVGDAVSDAGPIAGIVSLLAVASQSLVLMLAIDMPYMNPAYLRGLMRQCSGNCGAVPVKSGFYEGLAAIFPKAALPVAEKILRDSDHSMQHFVRECAEHGLVKIVGVASGDVHFFKSLNAPADLPPSM